MIEAFIIVFIPLIILACSGVEYCGNCGKMIRMIFLGRHYDTTKWKCPKCGATEMKRL
jgi:ribosomal protein S27AE